MMELEIVNADAKYSPVALIAPTTHGYIHIAAEVDPPSRPGPIIGGGRERAALITRLKEDACQVEQLAAVERIIVFEATAVAPPSAYARERGDAIHPARFDVVALIETASLTAAGDVQATPSYQSLIETLTSGATRMHVIVARCAKRVGDVDTSRKGTFLFNYFVADDADVMLRLWDYLAGWYAVETGLDNSVLLVPQEGEQSEYLAINLARWDGSPLRLFARQLCKKSFRTYLQANLEANRVGAMAVLYRLA